MGNLFTLSSHTRTHIDAPSHMFEEGRKLGNYSISSFWDNSIIIGWAKLWGKESYFEGYSSLTVEAIQFLADKNIVGIATITIIIDSVGPEIFFDPHHVLSRKDMLIVENLPDQEEIKTDHFYFPCMPLKIAGSEASPVRAFVVEMQRRDPAGIFSLNIGPLLFS